MGIPGGCVCARSGAAQWPCVRFLQVIEDPGLTDAELAFMFKKGLLIPASCRCLRIQLTWPGM